jgi:aspartate/methionine/tyrosine aminotransferase
VNHTEFLKLQAQVRVDRPEVLDLSELNLYRSLALPAIAPSKHAEAPYRCHVAERYLDHLGYPRELKSRAQVSGGVRRSLRAIFGLLAKRNARVAIPSDVYPTYLSLAAEAEVQVVPYPARRGLPDLNYADAILVCEPLKPWGGSLTPADTAHLSGWARERTDRLVLLDSAYATPPTAAAKQLMDDETAALLVSLSKSFLIPDHVGLCILPTHWQAEARAAFASLPKNEERLRIGFAALTEHLNRPGEVSAFLESRAARMDTITQSRPELNASKCIGYFATSTRSFEELLSFGILAAPASVFGGPRGESILSSLAPAPHAAP